MKDKFLNILRNYYPHILVILFFCLGLLPGFNKSSSILRSDFNYLDSTLFYEALSRFSQGQIIYKDFYWEYGFLYLIISLPVFLLFGKTFFISHVLSTAILPFLGVILTVYIGYLLFSSNKKAFLIFLLLELSYKTGIDFTSLRHLLPELSVLLVIFGFEHKNPKQMLFGFVLLGISFISSVEYAVIGLLSLLVFFSTKAFFDYKILFSVKNFLIRGVLLFLLISTPFYLYLHVNKSLVNYITYMSQSSSSFYAYSPCREYFPRSDNLVSSDLFGSIIKVDLYVIPIILLLLLVFIISRYKRREEFYLLPLVVFALLSFIRPLITPCEVYFSYGLTFVFVPVLFVVFFVPKIPSYQKWVAFGILVWLLLPVPKKIINIITNLLESNVPKVEQSYLPGADLYLNKDVTDDFNEVVAFLKTNTTSGDYIYTYPHGSYHTLSGRKSPVRIISTLHSELAPFLKPYVVEDLKNNPPKYIVLSGYNTWSYLSVLTGLSYDVYNQGTDIFFSGYSSDIEEYLMDNYRLAKKFKYAWVLEKKDISDLGKNNKLLVEIPITKEITISENASVSADNHVLFHPNGDTLILAIDDLRNASRVKLTFSSDLGITKLLQKHGFMIYILPSADSVIKNPIPGYTNFLPSGDFEIVFNMPSPNANFVPAGLAISVSKNLGFLPSGYPKDLKVSIPILYMINPNTSFESDTLMDSYYMYVGNK